MRKKCREKKKIKLPGTVFDPGQSMLAGILVSLFFF
jgi:hypothetical protein